MNMLVTSFNCDLSNNDEKNSFYDKAFNLGQISGDCVCVCVCVCVQTVLRRVNVSERRCWLRCVQPGRRSVSSQNALQTVATARRSVTLPQDTAGASEWTAAGRCRAPLQGDLSFCDDSSLSFDATGL